MSYVWSKERIVIDFGSKEVAKEFLPLDIIDYPVELVSDDGEIYMLWITDEEEGEWWYIVETSKNVINQYIEGKISVRDIFDRGKAFVAFRSYEEYDKVKNLVPLEEKIKEGFIKEDELPTYNAKFEADMEIIEEIKSKMFKDVDITFEDKVEELETELSSVSYSEAPEAEISLAA